MSEGKNVRQNRGNENASNRNVRMYFGKKSSLWSVDNVLKILRYHSIKRN